MTETDDPRATISGVAPTDAGLDSASARSASPLNTSASSARSFGAALSQERERQGRSISEIAACLRLHPRQIAALEQEQLQELPEPAFVRGFVRNYARELRLAPEALLAQLNARLPLDNGTALARGGSAAVRAGGGEGLSRGLTIFGIVGALVVLGVVGWIAKPSRAPATPAAAKVETAPVAIPAPPAASVEAAPLVSAPQQATAAGTNNVSGATAPAPASKTTPAPNVPPITAGAAAPSAFGGEAAAPTAAAASAVIGTMRLVVGDRPSRLEGAPGDGRP